MMHQGLATLTHWNRAEYAAEMKVCDLLDRDRSVRGQVDLLLPRIKFRKSGDLLYKGTGFVVWAKAFGGPLL